MATFRVVLTEPQNRPLQPPIPGDWRDITADVMEVKQDGSLTFSDLGEVIAQNYRDHITVAHFPAGQFLRAWRISR
jgi:hypothetical protein